MSVTLSNLSPNIRIPLFYVQFDNSMAGANQSNQRALIIGQTMTGFTQPAVPAYNDGVQFSINSYGAGSTLARMVTQYRNNDTFGELWCLPLPDASGATAATGTITFAATGASAGTFPLYVGGQSAPFAVNSGDTATTIGANAAAAVNATTSMPCTAAAASGVVTFTAKNKGLTAGDIDISVAYEGVQNGEIVPGGVTYSITAFTGGGADPDLVTNAVGAAMGAKTFDYIAMPYWGATQMTEMKAIMGDSTGRWSPMQQLFGHVFTAKRDTAANLLTYGATNNDQHSTAVGIPGGVGGSPTPSFEWAAAWTGAVAPSANADPALPLQTLAIQGVLAPQPSQIFTASTQQSLLTTGIALPAFADDGSASILRSVTTYQTNAFGQADQSYLDVETMFTLMAITRQLKSAITQKFSRAKLADNGTTFGPGQRVVTPNIIFAEIAAQYALMESNGLVEDAAAMTAATKVVRNAQDPSRVDVLFAPYLISGLRIFAVLNQFRLLSQSS